MADVTIETTRRGIQVCVRGGLAAASVDAWWQALRPTIAVAIQAYLESPPKIARKPFAQPPGTYAVVIPVPESILADRDYPLAAVLLGAVEAATLRGVGHARGEHQHCLNGAPCRREDRGLGG